MNRAELLHKLSEFKIYITEERRLHDGTTVLIFRSHLPEIPHGRQHVWATLTLEPGQEFIEREEIEPILRHLWHGSALFFGDELERELQPIDPHECVIAEKVDAHVWSQGAGSTNLDDEAVSEQIRGLLGFELSSEHREYLEAYVRMRRAKPKS